MVLVKQEMCVFTSVQTIQTKISKVFKFDLNIIDFSAAKSALNKSFFSVASLHLYIFIDFGDTSPRNP